MVPPESIVGQFLCKGDLITLVPHGTGNINDTYRVVFDLNPGRKTFILQRVNNFVFKDVPAVMQNIGHVLRHQRRKVEDSGLTDVDRRVMTIVQTPDGDDYLTDSKGNFWRMFCAIPQSKSVDSVEKAAQVYEAARVFGKFQHHLADLPVRLHETIPAFHHTRKRFDSFIKVVEEDSFNRAKDVRDDIQFVMDSEYMVDRVVDGLASGVIPERVTHNDTKLNNVLLDETSGEGLCVIDLDTVMPGSILYDFGDLVRASTCSVAEDVPDAALVKVDLEYFGAITRGYLESASGFIVQAERELLAFSGQLISLELGMRFLTDYLTGDVYFKTARPAQNVDRCRRQFMQARAMHENMEEMERIVTRSQG
jgi:hypothetical protein